MRIGYYRWARGQRSHGGLVGTLFVLLAATVPDASAQTVYRACLVPEVGAMYVIGLEGLPESCLSSTHQEITWSEAGDVAAGLSCWDTDDDGVKDSSEDVDGNGIWDAEDCRGAQGESGTPGNDGLSCWDANGDGNKDVEEDLTGDSEWNALDCQGEGATIPDGSITTEKLDDGAVTAAKIASGAVGSTELAAGGVSSSALSHMGATSDQVLTWTGSAWAPRTPGELTIHNGATVSVPVNGIVLHHETCPSGMVVSGGWEQASGRDLLVRRSFPSSATSWEFQFENNYSSPISVNAHLLCSG